MATLAQLVRILPWADWLALVVLFGGWTAYARFARQRSTVRPSVLDATNRERRRWMREATVRDNRVLDGIVVQNLSSPPSFFASTTILIIGALLATLFASDKASEFVREVPFAARTSVLVFDLKLVVLTAIFVFAFFRFTWSVRQYSFGVILVAALPPRDQFVHDDAAREAFAERAGRIVGMAAESLNDGIRAYYMSFAAAAWFISPWACMLATTGVIWVLYRREFHSDVLRLLLDGERSAAAPAPQPAAASPPPSSPPSAPT
ncbi:MAG: DUF599 domain-containing protein [Rubrivivax sp.]|nr:DUF599 domain-containing protein [Rubrivivax sp.]